MTLVAFKVAKGAFFDTRKVLAAVGKARARVLSKIGAYVMTTARRSIRKRKAYSRPGQPPSDHSGLLKHFIFFRYDQSSDSVVIGPVRFGRSDAPRLLEHGGVTNRKRRGRLTRMRYKARPFMQPALEKEKPGFAEIWRNSVKT